MCIWKETLTCYGPSKNSPQRFKTLQCLSIQIFRIFWKILRMLKINTKTQELKLVTCKAMWSKKWMAKIEKHGWQICETCFTCYGTNDQIWAHDAMKKQLTHPL